ncbi:MAG: formylglycine-generating enzyme family protein, partial [Thermoguttaceae bacterium]|nr:formylglycine-generating enzyme family protein [Thermoguttaceae bacterium]
ARESEERRLAEEAASRAERLAAEAEEAARRAEEELRLAEEASRRAEEERLARAEQERRRDEAERLAREAGERRAAAEARRKEAERSAREAEERRRAESDEKRKKEAARGRSAEKTSANDESQSKKRKDLARSTAAVAKAWRGEGEVPGARQILRFKGVELPFRWCPPGTFRMGSPADEPGRDDLETLRKTTLTRGFWLLETPTTQAMWRAALGENPSAFQLDGARDAERKSPVENVSWFDCVHYVAAMNASGVAPDGWRFALPTEAQWEYACRAGTNGPVNVRGASLEEAAYFRDNSGGRPRSVGGKKANAWGFFDMLGNVWEFCADCFAPISAEPASDPTGPAGGSRAARAARGGGWRSGAEFCRSASRIGVDPTSRAHYYGARLALVRVAESTQETPPAASR